MRTAIYVRVSTEAQFEEGYSIEEQLDRLRKYCELKDFVIQKEYVDGGFSGAKLDRPAMNELMRDARKKLFDVVLVYKLDRLSRSQLDTLWVIQEVFDKNNIAFISMCENFDTSTPFGRAMIGILATFAQLERDQIRERLLMGRIGRAKKGLFRGGATPPTGYDYNSEGMLVINPYEAMQIKTIYKMYLEGYSVTHIAKYMNANFTNKYKNYAYDSSVRKMLTNSTYTGKVKFNGEEYDGVHEPIIDVDTFNKVQQEIKRRSKRKLAPTLFKATGLLVGFAFCAKCGRPYHQKYHGDNKRKFDENGNRVYRIYYQCTSYHKKRYEKCGNKQHRKEKIEGLVIDEIKKLKYDETYFDKVKTPPVVKDDNNTIIEQEIAKVEEQMSKLIELYANDMIPKDILSKQITELNEKKDKLVSSLEDDEEEEEQPKMSKQEVMNIVEAVDTIFSDKCDMLQKREFVQALIDKIVIDENDVHIYWNF